MATYPAPLLPDGYYPSPFPYASLSYPAPTSRFSPAPVYGSPNLPSAATYQQPPAFTSHASPFPFVYNAPPASPYAGTCRISHPASAYTPTAGSFSPAPTYGHHTIPSTVGFPPPPSGFGAPAPGFSPNWPTWPPRAPDSTPSTAPSTFPSTTTSSPPNFPVELGNNFFPAQPYHYKPESTTPPTPAPATTGAHATPPSNLSSFSTPVAAVPQPDTAPTTPNRELLPPQSHTSKTCTHRPLVTSPEGLADLVPLLKLPDREIDASERHARGTTADIGFGSSVSSTPTAQTPSFSSTPSGSRTTAVYAPSTLPNSGAAAIPSATSHGALQVFAEMPQPYGLHNLDNQSVFLADGTERRYYVLPDNYPLERATPGPMFDACADETDGCSTEFVYVLAKLPEQQTHEQEQQKSAQPTKCSKANNAASLESMLVHNLQVSTTMQDAFSVFKEMPVYDIYEEDNSCMNCMDEQLATPFPKASENASREQLLTCFSKAAKTEQTSACLDIVTDVLDVTLELQQQDDEKRANCSVIMASDSVVTWSSHFNIEHNLRELRLLWDPGAHTSLSSTRNRDIVGVLHNTVLQSMGDQVDCLNPLSLTTPWDPGVLVMHSGIIRNSTRTARDAEWSKNSSHTSCKLPQPSGVKWSAFQVMSNYLNAIFNLRMMQNAIQCLGYWSTINTSSLSTLALSYFTNHMLLVLSASYKEVTEDCLDDQEQQKYEHALTCFSKPHQVQFVQQTTEFSIITSDACTQYDTSNGTKSVRHGTSFCSLYEFLILTSDACTQRTTHSSPENYLCSLFGNNVLKTEYCQMSYVWEFSVSSKKRVQWDPGVKIYTDTWLDILTVWSEIDKPLSFTHIRDLEAWPNQFVGSTASYIWDPGTTLPWYKSIWWLMFIEENELVHFKLEFIHQQGVQENYNAKQLLLSSQDSVNIREIGIVFTTFRPP